MESTYHKSRQAERIRLRLQETKSLNTSFELGKKYLPRKPSSLAMRPEFPLPFAGYGELTSQWQRAQLGKWTLTYDVKQQLANILNRLDALSVDISSMKGELDRCKRSIIELREKLETRPIVKQTNITEIGDGFQVKMPIPVTIEEYDDEVTASFPEVEVFGSGATEAEAISRLKKEIRELYNELLKTPREELGYLPLAWLRVMEATIEENGQTR